MCIEYLSLFSSHFDFCWETWVVLVDFSFETLQNDEIQDTVCYIFNPVSRGINHMQ